MTRPGCLMVDVTCRLVRPFLFRSNHFDASPGRLFAFWINIPSHVRSVRWPQNLLYTLFQHPTWSSMATIKAIEAKSVHQIQSGQVIVDLCSVVKELVENSLDAGATAIEIRFRNNGLDAIEVQDNGGGISPTNYANIALKHYTSKLSSYDDLTLLETFGFRGEALSSLCALSNFFIITAQADEAPKGTRLEFDTMGALKSTSTVACQKGTTATVENLFSSLPVRRKELSKNIKREYGKVIGLLNAYACIGVGVKYTVKNIMPKGKSMVVFSTQGNTTTRDNVANIYGAKTLPALVALDLDLDTPPSLTQMAQANAQTMNVSVKGHISKPVFGEGRQTPDRQMFFVNGRPCSLPQIAKGINEVYKSFNVSQSPFIVADLRMDTTAYDVNVSPDKRTILLHNAAGLIERLKECLTELFNKHEQTVPHSQFQTSKLPSYKPLSVQGSTPATPDSDDSERSRVAPVRPRLQNDQQSLNEEGGSEDEHTINRAFANHFRNQASTREPERGEPNEKQQAQIEKDRQRRATKAAAAVQELAARNNGIDEYDDLREVAHIHTDDASDDTVEESDPKAIHVRDFNARMAEQKRPDTGKATVQELPIPSTTPIRSAEAPGVVQNAFDRMRSRRAPAQLATITVDGETTTAVVGTQMPKVTPKYSSTKSKNAKNIIKHSNSSLTQFSQRLQRFGAESTQRDETEELDQEASTDASLVDESADAHSQSEDDDDALSEVDRDDAETAASIGGDEDSVDDHDGGEHNNADREEEDARVAELIQAAEQTMSKVNSQHAQKALKGVLSKDKTASLLTTVEFSMEGLPAGILRLQGIRAIADDASDAGQIVDRAGGEEERLSLTVSKEDFADMEIVGQFNLGFILAVRRADPNADGHERDELFIIDQHASDEKFNFERLQAETVVSSQRMVRPVMLDLTAVDEEVVLENPTALEKNGFLVETDTSGTQPVGRRCTLLGLPLSKEATFDMRDFEELIHLLSESPMLGSESAIPRPGRVRKMFAMRACRSSIMIGKTLSQRQMKTVVTHMGTIDKPWNCPHGRPTMRHLTSLNALDAWNEGDGVWLHKDDPAAAKRSGLNAGVWQSYVAGD